MKHLYGKYYLDTDKLNFIICRKSGEDRYKPIGFFRTLDALIIKLKEMYVFDNVLKVDSDSLIKELVMINEYVYNNDIYSVTKEDK